MDVGPLVASLTVRSHTRSGHWEGTRTAPRKIPRLSARLIRYRTRNSQWHARPGIASAQDVSVVSPSAHLR